ncbi:Uncharacterised protein [Mycobacterium tuberculosis]|nr:Uncharacterised protein [Mycobacterium tuberculosis]CKP51344.1 Uncharacterised protein [Mycobacterium tuberculosis]CKP66636.1 Uncharacterised protein [Mycobacterium tuberculosis]
MPSTRIASISSRMVRAPRSAQIAVAPAPATTSTVTTGPSWVMVPNAVPAPDKSAAPISRNRMLRVNATRTVNGMDTSNVGTSETRATIQVWSKNSRNWNGRRKAARAVSIDISKNPPTARAGTASCWINWGPPVYCSRRSL